MSMEQAFNTFILEASELLEEMESNLLCADQIEDKDELVNSVFRAAHTIKGSAGLFGLDPIVEFTHVVESVLDRVRDGELALDEPMISLMLLCKDYIGQQIDSIEDGVVIVNDDDRKQEQELVAKLSTYLDKSDEENSQSQSEDEANHQFDVLPVDKSFSNDNWHISVHFGSEVLRNGMDPLSFIRYLTTIGDIIHIETVFHAMPDLDDMDPEDCYLGFEINFSSDADKASIEDVFEFVRDDCELHIIPPKARVGDFIEVIEALEGDDLKLGEMLVECGTLTQKELDKVLKRQEALHRESDERRKIGELLVEDDLAAPEVVEAAIKKQSQFKSSRDKQSQSVRVDSEKLDSLINLIGELVIAGASMEEDVRQAGMGSLIESMLPMIRLIEEVRDGALNLRMVQIGDTFNRFHRVVRDVAKDLDKDIALHISGGETELDKTVIEKIGDPLTHLVRNSMDHGIEDRETRIAAGKAEQGNVYLNAFHESGSIVIEVKDDGGGLNRDKILAKALDKNLIASGEELSDQQVYQLIFEAGFSTADQVSNISGRGVGMDVVRRNIEALRGSIEIDSEPGCGTTLRIRLPLTLAIIDGFQVRAANADYVIPLDMVVECIELNPEDLGADEESSCLSLRGEVLPFIRLKSLFGRNGGASKRESIVVLQYGSVRAGLVVDSLQGELQTVIKPLNKMFESVTGIGGATILGSGEVALILDVPTLIQRIERSERWDGNGLIQPQPGQRLELGLDQH